MIRASVILLLLVRVVQADNPSLEQARTAVRDVRYDAAQRLLIEALQRGSNGPDELREIYQLSAAASIVLGQQELASQYYRRMLAVAPDADLLPDASPRLREPFVAAQAFMAAQPRFGIHAVRNGTSIEVKVSDPLRMVFAIVASRAGIRLATVRNAAEPVVIEVADVDEIAVIDEYGNRLRSISGAELGHAPALRASPTPLLRRWTTWAVPAAAFAGVGVAFLIAGQQSKANLDDIVANSSGYYLTDAEAARTSWRRDTQLANVAFGVAGAFAVTAAVMALVRPDPRSNVAAAVTRDAAFVTFSGRL